MSDFHCDNCDLEYSSLDCSEVPSCFNFLSPLRTIKLPTIHKFSDINCTVFRKEYSIERSRLDDLYLFSDKSKFLHGSDSDF